MAVDPPVTGHAASDECGIVVAGVYMRGPPQDWRAVVLEDASVQGLGAAEWAAAAVDAFRRHGADRMVAEVNQGGDLVERVVEGDPWHGPNVVALLDGVSARDAAAEVVPGAHSIWQLVLHMTGWTREVRARLEGEAAGEPAGEQGRRFAIGANFKF